PLQPQRIPMPDPAKASPLISERSASAAATTTPPAPLELPDYLPARMLNEYVYCPRLFFYEWVEGVFENSPDTLDGQAKHTRVDSGPSPMPEAEGMNGEAIHSRSVTLSSERVGLTAKLDLIASDASAADGKSVRPVDYKRGKPREVDGIPAPWP